MYKIASQCDRRISYRVTIVCKTWIRFIQQGWKKYGARSYTKDGSDYAFVDAEYNNENIYWQEAMSIFETVLDMNVSCDDREAIILLMIVTYQNMGYVSKQSLLAEKQNSLIMSKELLLPKATESELRDRYQGEAIIYPC